MAVHINNERDSAENTKVYGGVCIPWPEFHTYIR